MHGRVEWINGDMFDGASDLLVIPCSTLPTVTPTTAERLREFAIPDPSTPMQLGDVVLAAPPGKSTNLATCVAYAASVRANNSSDLAAIERIGEQLGEAAAADDRIRRIAAPLLGTGAGGLPYRDAAVHLTRGFLRAAPEMALLRVFVLDERWFRELRTLAGERATGPDATVDFVEKPIRVFVTYAHSSEDHKAWVRTLATFLRQNGLDARLDAWHLRPGMDMPQWMCNELEMANRVVVVIDALYSQKADGRHGGVGWETKLLMGELYSTQSENPDKFIPVFVDGASPAEAPTYLRPALGIIFPADDAGAAASRQALLEALFRVYDEAPPIGQPPSFVLARTAAA